MRGLLQAQLCYLEKKPFWWQCNDVKHAAEHCAVEDYKLRMMVYITVILIPIPQSTTNNDNNILFRSGKESEDYVPGRRELTPRKCPVTAKKWTMIRQQKLNT